MLQQLENKRQKQSIYVNRVAYILYLILVIYLVIQGDMEWAVINLGVAMVFDPFNTEVKWRQRPLYQRLWLVAHLTLVLAGFVFLILR